jgi:hypothetical protein
MSENPSVKSNTAVIEAPASWNKLYTTPEGFICQISQQADSCKELLEKTQEVLAGFSWLTEYSAMLSHCE